MAVMNLETIMRAGLLMAFVLPMLAVVSNTLPPPAVTPGGVNVSEQLNTTGIYIYNQFSHSYINTSTTLLGNCGAPTPAGIPSSSNKTANGTTCSGSLYSNPTIFSAFAFIINGIGTVITNIIQLPYLDWLSLQMMVTGLSTVLPAQPIGFLSIGVNLLYLYMGISLLLMAVGLIQKYNPKVG